MKTANHPAKQKAHHTRKQSQTSEVHTLAIDIGGTGLKASILNADGEMVTDRLRVKTPHPCPPEVLLETLGQLIAPLPPYRRVSVGLPGVVRKGRVLTAHNLGEEAWKGFDLAGALAKQLGKPVQVLNDAEIQGLGAIQGAGIELVITLGTGLGSAFFEDGRLSPHLEVAHHPFRKGETYEEQLGNKALQKIGKKKWNRRLQRAIETLRALTHFDYLYIGGGNASRIDFQLDPEITIISNECGMKGGIWLWQKKPNRHAESRHAG